MERRSTRTNRGPRRASFVREEKNDSEVRLGELLDMVKPKKREKSDLEKLVAAQKRRAKKEEKEREEKAMAERKEKEEEEKRNRPPFWRERNALCCDFLNGQHFGNGFHNEEKYKYNKWYNYWNTYARPDFARSPSLEKRCFGCKELFETSDEIPKVCGVAGCPKVMHKSCWNYFHCVKVEEETKQAYFKFMEEDILSRCSLLCSFVDRQEAGKREVCQLAVCPRHICANCHRFSAESMSYCPTCPASYCSDCIGIQCESLCRVCSQFPSAMEAPEMRNVRYCHF